jgi:hypothetical protein
MLLGIVLSSFLLPWTLLSLHRITNQSGNIISGMYLFDRVVKVKWEQFQSVWKVRWRQYKCINEMGSA